MKGKEFIFLNFTFLFLAQLQKYFRKGTPSILFSIRRKDIYFISFGLLSFKFS